MSQQKPIHVVDFKAWDKSVDKLLSATELRHLIAKGQTIILKPNLVNAEPPPVTTPAPLIAAIAKYIHREIPKSRVIVAEGCGTPGLTTQDCYRALGYTEIADVELIDLNGAELVHLKKRSCKRWPEMYLPEILMDSFLISVPVLKAHSLADVTLSMKNMVGVAPPEHYNAGSWLKSAFHTRIHEAILDLNRYRQPDFSIVDATVGMQQAHLWGPTCSPPPNLLFAGEDPVSVDAYGAAVLGFDWEEIDHIRLANGVLGNVSPSEIIEVE